MKINKLFSIDVELATELKKEKNASELINNLLKEYYVNGNKFTKVEIQKTILDKENKKVQLNKELLKIDEDLKILSDSLRSIDKKELVLKERFKRIPNEIINTFKSFPAMTEEVLKMRYNDWKSDYNLTYEEVLSAFNEYFKERK